MPNRVGSSKDPCLTPHRMGKLSDIEPSKDTAADMLSWSDLVRLSRVDGHPSF